MGKVAAPIATGFAAVATVMACVMVWKRVDRRLRTNRAFKLAEDFQNACDVTVLQLQMIADHMSVEMFAGLATEGGSRMSMLLTYVQDLPTGKEKGSYYAVDLGSTDLRILRIHFGGTNSAPLIQIVNKIPIPQRLLTSSSKELFDFVATFLKDTVEQEETEVEQGLGFSFPFPVKHVSSFSSGTLVKWTKGFAVEDLVGKDVTQCLQEAMSRKGLNLRVAALINDTVGTLALSHFYDEDTVAAVMLGTGTNACYFELCRCLVKCPSLSTTPGGMVVNMEWGNYWSTLLPRTSYDMALDADSPHPKHQGFEKMISGMYLGEIVRRVILKMLQESELEALSSKLHEPFILSTPMIAEMQSDDSSNLDEVARIFRDTLEIPKVSLYIRRLVVIICDAVTRRAARMAAAGIAGILKKIGRDGTGGGVISPKDRKTKGYPAKRTVVAVEGDLYTNYKMFKDYLDEALEELLGKEVAPHIIIKMIEDGPGIGAAVLAASHPASSSGDTI